MGIWLGSAEGESAVKAPKCVDHSNLERISADLIQAQLERIIASGSFDASRRNRFLRFIVEEALAESAPIASRLTRSPPVCSGAPSLSMRNQIPSCESKRAGSGEVSNATI
jgi:hypothetical protein